MSELKAKGQITNDTRLVYLKDEVDTVLDEKDKTIADAVKIMKEQEHEISEKDKEIEELNDEIHKLKRALYKACANWAKSERYTEATWHGDEHREDLWANVQTKCRAKAEEYK